MGRLSRVKNRLLGKSKPDGGSKGSSGVSSRSATPLPTGTSLTLRVGACFRVRNHLRPDDYRASASQRPTPPAASDAASSPSYDVNPWGTAYKIFQEREPELMADYAQHLASV
ncbi:hypothetical protein GE09DRAFT_1228813 [Coniochaeta sp. 2T2.1]|nr:hypothetical protein GE09DRAFT_1228813 [Coniochaeta sp. 2T2.1]